MFFAVTFCTFIIDQRLLNEPSWSWFRDYKLNLFVFWGLLPTGLILGTACYFGLLIEIAERMAKFGLKRFTKFVILYLVLLSLGIVSYAALSFLGNTDYKVEPGLKLTVSCNIAIVLCSIVAVRYLLY